MQTASADTLHTGSSKAAANTSSSGRQSVAYAPPDIDFSSAYKAITDAVAEDGNTFFGHEGADYPALGLTNRPENHDGPEINFRPVRKKNQWYSKPVLQTGSNEGTNDSWALEEGDHVVPGLMENGKPVHAIIDANMAALIMAAENEHTADFRFAAEGILTAGDTWLRNNLRTLGHNGEFGPSGTKDDVIARAEEGINPPLKTALGLTGVEDFEWANLGAYYLRACTQTEKRDDNDWHSFDTDKAEMDDRVNHTTTIGDTEIGTHPSADVIDFSEVE